MYAVFKIFIRLALWLFCRRVTVSDKAVLNAEGPLLLAANHPNSFLDAIIIGSLFKRPVHILARGDVFRNPLVAKLLRALKLIPIYRLSEGREYLALNDVTFEQCHHILEQGGIILIFAEGLCKNDWNLRPLKKGTARIALHAWSNENLREYLQIIPVGISYNSFRHFGKKIVIHFSKPIANKDLPGFKTEGENINWLNDLLSARLAESILQVEKTDTKALQFLISNHPEFVTTNAQLIIALQNKLKVDLQFNFLKIMQEPYFILKSNLQMFWQVFLLILTLPVVILSFFLNLPLYLVLKRFAAKKTEGTVFYDSVLFAMLLLLYPLWWLICLISIWLLAKDTVLLIIAFAMPLLAWVHIWWKQTFQACRNYQALGMKEKRELNELLAS